jgi:hypothetical protein
MVSGPTGVRGSVQGVRTISHRTGHQIRRQPGIAARLPSPCTTAGLRVHEGDPLTYSGSSAAKISQLLSKTMKVPKREFDAVLQKLLGTPPKPGYSEASEGGEGERHAAFRGRPTQSAQRLAPASNGRNYCTFRRCPLRVMPRQRESQYFQFMGTRKIPKPNQRSVYSGEGQTK